MLRRPSDFLGDFAATYTASSCWVGASERWYGDAERGGRGPHCPSPQVTPTILMPPPPALQIPMFLYPCLTPAASLCPCGPTVPVTHILSKLRPCHYPTGTSLFIAWQDFVFSLLWWMFSSDLGPEDFVPRFSINMKFRFVNLFFASPEASALSF